MFDDEKLAAIALILVIIVACVVSYGAGKNAAQNEYRDWYQRGYDFAKYQDSFPKDSPFYPVIDWSIFD